MLKPVQILLVCIMVGALIAGALAFPYDGIRLNSVTPRLNITKIEGSYGCIGPIKQICIAFNLTIDNPSDYHITLNLLSFNASTILYDMYDGIQFSELVQFTLLNPIIVTIPPRSQSYVTIWTGNNVTNQGYVIITNPDWIIERLVASGGGDHVEWQWIVYSDWFGTWNTRDITYDVSINWSSPTEFAVCK